MSLIYDIDPCFAYRRTRANGEGAVAEVVEAIGPSTALVNAGHLLMSEMALLDADALHVSPTRFDASRPYDNLVTIWSAFVENGWFDTAGTKVLALKTPEYCYAFVSAEPVVERAAQESFAASGWENVSLTETQYEKSASHTAAVRRVIGGPFSEDELRCLLDDKATILPAEFTRETANEVVQEATPLRRLANLLPFSLPGVMPETTEDWQVTGLVRSGRDVLGAASGDESIHSLLPVELLDLQSRFAPVATDTLIHGIQPDQTTNTLKWDELHPALTLLAATLTDPDGEFADHTSACMEVERRDLR